MRQVLKADSELHNINFSFAMAETQNVCSLS